MCVFRKHLSQPVAEVREAWLGHSQVIKGLDCQAKEFGHCSQGTREPQKSSEQGREGRVSFECQRATM